MKPVADTIVSESVDHLFRHHAGQMVSVLCRGFGLEHIDLIEDAVQDSMIAALRRWPYAGLPENPRAWLTEVAKNRILDKLRRAKKQDRIDDGLYEVPAEPDYLDDLHFSGEIVEDQLRMIFACCHTAVPPDSQVALTLKIVGGFNVAEIASAFLANEEAVAKMLTRAKAKLRGANVSLDIPAPSELKERLESVLKVLYLMFNEGYTASAGDELLRKDLCFEAIRLAQILAAHPVTSAPRVHALTALFLFQASRLSARSDHHGELLLLAEQDRSLWDQQMLSSGIHHFRRSAIGDELTDYHLEAEIASLHSLVPDFDATDWSRIVECYDILQSRRFSPIVELNRIVAVGKVFGSQRALNELNILAENYLMTSFNLFHISRAHFLAENEQIEEARNAYETASRLTHNKSVRRFIQKKIDNLR